MPPGLGPEHAILVGLRDRSSEIEVTRTFARIFQADPRLAARFVHGVLTQSKRGHDPRWKDLPASFRCRAEVPLSEGRVDLEFSDDVTGWRVLVELKIDAGYGFDQVNRYLRALDKEDMRQVLVSITRDEPKYGDPPLDCHQGWAGSVAWASLMRPLRELRPSNPVLAQQWPLLLDVLEMEGSMGITEVDPELLLAWARSVPARKHAVAFMESLRNPLLEALRDELQQLSPMVGREALAVVSATLRTAGGLRSMFSSLIQAQPT